MKKLYIVSTYYHALISCVKQLVFKEYADIIVTDYIPDGKALAARINNTCIFDKTYYVGNINEYQPKNWFDLVFFFHKKNSELIESQLPFSFGNYCEINIFHDDIWAAHFLKDRRISYRLIEDSLDCFKTISKTSFSYMLPKSKIKTAIKKALRIGYVFLGLDSSTAEIEVNEAKDLEISSFSSDKIKAVSRAEMFNALSESDKECLLQIFAVNKPNIHPEKSVILLTQPLYIDGVVKDEREQFDLYETIVRENLAPKEDLVIKPHPRDNMDYLNLFPNAVIIDKNMPAEILSYIIKGDFSKAVTYFSSSIYSIKAKKHINYGGRL